MNAAVVELNTLTDADGTTTDNHRFIFGFSLRLVLLFVGAVEVGSSGVKLSGSGIHHLVDGADIPVVAERSYLLGKPVGQGTYLLIGEAKAFCRAQELRL